MSCRWLWWWVLLGLVAGCAASEPVVSRAGGPHPADAIPLARRLPDDCPALLVAPSLTQLREDLAWQSWVHRMGPALARVERRVAREAGADLLEPSVWVASGVAASSPVVVAAVAADPGGDPLPVIGLVARDPGLLRASLYRFLGDEVRQVETVGRHLVVDLGPLAVILAERDAIVVVGFDAVRVARRIARTEGEGSIARHRPFRAALRRVPDAGLRGFVDLRALAYLVAGMDTRWRGETTAEARRGLEAYHGHRLRHATRAEEAVDLDAGLRASHGALRDDAAARELRALLGGIEPAGVSLAHTEGGWRLRLALGLVRGGVLDRIFARDRPRRTSHLEGEDTFAVRFAVDPEALEEALGEHAQDRIGPTALEGLRALTGRGELLLGPPGAEAPAAGVAGWLGLRDAQSLQERVPELAEGRMAVEELGELPVELSNDVLTVLSRPDWELRRDGGTARGVRRRPLEVGGTFEAFLPLLVPAIPQELAEVEEDASDVARAREEAREVLVAWTEAASRQTRSTLRALGRIDLVVDHVPGELALTARWLPAKGWVEALAGALRWRRARFEEDPRVSAALGRWMKARAEAGARPAGDAKDGPKD